MKLVIGAVATVSSALFALSMASANPSLLPKHEGYPMKNSGSPVTGQPTANDPGQSDAHGESTLMKSADSIKRAQQNLTKTDNARITTGQGANQLPTVQGPQIMIAPPVTSATKITGDRKIVFEPFSWIQQGGAGPIRRPPLFLFVRSEWGL